MGFLNVEKNAIPEPTIQHQPLAWQTLPSQIPHLPPPSPQHQLASLGI